MHVHEVPSLSQRLKFSAKYQIEGNRNLAKRRVGLEEVGYTSETETLNVRRRQDVQGQRRLWKFQESLSVADNRSPPQWIGCVRGGFLSSVPFSYSGSYPELASRRGRAGAAHWAWKGRRRLHTDRPATGRKAATQTAAP